MSFNLSTTGNRSLALACAVSLMVGLWFTAGVIGDLSSWNDWDKPMEVKKLLEGLVFAFAAFLLALGVDLRSLLGPFASILPGGVPPESPKG